MNYNCLRVPWFKPYLKEINSETVSCGGHVVAAISGIELKYIRDLHPCNEDWSFEWVRTFLFLAGWGLVPIDKDFYNKRDGFQKLFHPHHLMVYLLAIDKRESTWACSHKGKVIHGQRMFDGMTGVEVFNNAPIEMQWCCAPLKQIKKLKFSKK